MKAEEKKENTSSNPTMWTEIVVGLTSLATIIYQAVSAIRDSFYDNMKKSPVFLKEMGHAYDKRKNDFADAEKTLKGLAYIKRKAKIKHDFNVKVDAYFEETLEFGKGMAGTYHKFQDLDRGQKVKILGFAAGAVAVIGAIYNLRQNRRIEEKLSQMHKDSSDAKSTLTVVENNEPLIKSRANNPLLLVEEGGKSEQQVIGAHTASLQKKANEAALQMPGGGLGAA